VTRALIATAIEPKAYAPYGAVVSARAIDEARSANYGTALAWDALATLTNLRGERARATASLFRCRPFAGERLEVRLLERHPDSTQMFVPMRAGRYLVVVAGGGEAPDLSTLAAFVVEGSSAITYAPGTWHHPMIALDAELDFVNVVFSDGTARDCEEQTFEAPVAAIPIPSRTERSLTETPTGVLLSAASATKTGTLDDVIGCIPYAGAPKTLADMDAGVMREARRRAGKLRKRRGGP
jgi:ureidoglycolate lyase